MIGLPLAHVGGIPVEETLGSLGPALLLGLGAASAKLSARRRRLRSRASAHASRTRGGRAERAGQ